MRQGHCLLFSLPRHCDLRPPVAYTLAGTASPPGELVIPVRVMADLHLDRRCMPLSWPGPQGTSIREPGFCYRGPRLPGWRANGQKGESLEMREGDSCLDREL